LNWYTGVQLYNYAVGGAVCSSDIVANMGVGVQEYEIPTFLADKATKISGQPFLTVSKNDTVFSIWIGTNDLGPQGFLTGKQVSPNTLVDYIDCVYSALDKMYAAGARKIVLMNLVPLNLAPLYALPGQGGVSWSTYWMDKPKANGTAASLKMEDMVLKTNARFKNLTHEIMNERKRYPAARLALFDTWSLVRFCLQFAFNTLTDSISSMISTTIPQNFSMEVHR
jgi:hypothetical protein